MAGLLGYLVFKQGAEELEDHSCDEAGGEGVVRGGLLGEGVR